MKENKMYDNLKKLSAYFNFIRIETRTINSIPDIYYFSIRYQNKNGWIENKQAKKYKNGTIKLRYEPGQIKTLKQFLFYNPRIFVFISLENIFYLTKTFKKIFDSKIDLQRNSIWYGSIIFDNELIKILEDGK